MLTLLLDGIAYGMLLFVLACGLSVTLGLMNFINLAHGSFAMAGGYIAVVLTTSLDLPFLWSLPLAFLGSGLIGAVLYALLYRHVYVKSHLEQVLFSIGIVFMSIAAVDYFMGSQQQFAKLPEYLQGRIDFSDDGNLGIGRYRLFIIVLCAALAIGLQWVLARTRFGSLLRASVDDRQVASGLGINVNAVFVLTFAAGSGLAGLGGALGTEILGLDPYFPLKFMIYFLVVVAVGGTSTITGPLAASLLLGIADVTGKYYVPQFGAFIIYCVMIVVLMLRPQGLFARGAGRA